LSTTKNNFHEIKPIATNFVFRLKNYSPQDDVLL
jgi:hypothetical protein